MSERPTAVRGYMPFAGHRTMAEVDAIQAYQAVAISQPVSTVSPVSPRNRRLIEQSERLVGRWR